MKNPMKNLRVRPTTAARILKFLASHGPANRYSIRESGETVAQPTILAAIKQLEKEGLIKGSKQKSSRTGKTSKHFDLTLNGLLYLVSHIWDSGLPIESRDIFLRNLAKKYRDLIPGIFDLWPAFGNMAAEGMAFTRLFFFCKSLWRAQTEDCMRAVDAELIAKNHAADFFADPLVFHQVDMQQAQMTTLFSEGLNVGGGWISLVQKNERLRSATIHSLISRIDLDVRKANDVLSMLSAEQLQVSTAEVSPEIQSLGQRVDEIKELMDELRLERRHKKG
jgi:DNA-binding PadR family transcriptional regulator